MEKKKKLPNGYWQTFENCLEVAKKYDNLRKFTQENHVCYNACIANGWLEKFPWLKRCDRKKEKWDTGNGKMVVQYTLDGKYVKTYKNGIAATKAVLKKDKVNDGANILNCAKGKVNSAYGYKWLFPEDMERAEEIFKEREERLYHWKRKPQGYTEEEVIEVAGNYATKKEFRENEPNYWSAAQRMGILDKLPFKRALNPYYDHTYSVYAYFFKETHSVYVGITDNKVRRKWQHKNDRSAVLEHAQKYNLEVPDPVYLENDLDPETALILEDEYKLRYKELGWNILNKAQTGLNSGSIGSARHLSVKKVIEEARKYETLKEFYEAKPSYYNYILSHHKLDKLNFLKRGRKIRGTITEEFCYNIAKECRTKEEFKAKDISAYFLSHVRGWFKQYWWLLDKQEVQLIAFRGFKVKVFKSATSASKYIGKSCKNGVKRTCEEGKKLGINFHILDMNDIDWNIPDFEHRVVI